MSSSPQPDPQHEQSLYCEVRGILALRAQIEGMFSLLEGVWSSGIVNSKRNIFCFPEKPSDLALAIIRVRYKWELTVSRDARTIDATFTVALFVSKNHELLVRDQVFIGQDFRLFSAVRALRVHVGDAVAPTPVLKLVHSHRSLRVSTY